MIILTAYLIGVAITFMIGMIALGYNWETNQTVARNAARGTATLNYPSQLFWRTTGWVLAALLAAGTWVFVIPTLGMWKLGSWLNSYGVSKRAVKTEKKTFERATITA